MPLALLPSNVNGLPTHPLVVHATVTVAVVAALGGMAWALVPRARRWLRWPLAATAVLCVVFGLVTPSTGEALEARVPESALVERHAELGDQMGVILIAYGLLLLVTVVVAGLRRRDPAGAEPRAAVSRADRLGAVPGPPLRAFPGQAPLAAVLALLVLAGAVVSGVWIVRTGEAGARAVWHDAPASAGPERPSDE